MAFSVFGSLEEWISPEIKHSDALDHLIPQAAQPFTGSASFTR
jgi:hypothetical protein